MASRKTGKKDHGVPVLMMTETFETQIPLMQTNDLQGDDFMQDETGEETGGGVGDTRGGGRNAPIIGSMLRNLASGTSPGLVLKTLSRL